MTFHRVIVAFDGSDRSADALAPALRQRWRVCRHLHRPDAPVPDELAEMFHEARATVPAGIRVRERALAGSVSEALTEGAAHPVIVVPRPAAERTPILETTEAR
jgi:nucleotide-binding universal stress UspA family protein